MDRQCLDQIDTLVFRKHKWTSVLAAYHQISATHEGLLTDTDKNKMRDFKYMIDMFYRVAPSYLAWMAAS